MNLCFNIPPSRKRSSKFFQKLWLRLFILSVVLDSLLLSMSDNQIIELIKSERSESINKAFRRLYKTCYRSIKGFVVSNNGSEEDSADIFQDSLIIFYIKVRKDEYELKSSIQAYLYAVARNLWLKKIRKSRVDISHLKSEESYNFDEDSIIQNSQTTIREVLDHIGGTCKNVLLDFYFKKLSMREIAESYKLGSEEAAKNKKYRCLKKLIELVKNSKLKPSDFAND